MMMHEENQRHLPGANTQQPGGSPVSWRVAILPYIEEAALFNQYKKDEPWDGPNNKPLSGRTPANFISPGDTTNNTYTNFYVITGPDTAFPQDQALRMSDIQDATGNTIFVVELGGGTIPWSEPRDITVDEF